jgi:hypothetical protein
LNKDNWLQVTIFNSVLSTDDHICKMGVSNNTKYGIR